MKAWLKNRPHESPYIFTSNRNLPIDRNTLDWLIKGYGEKLKLPADSFFTSGFERACDQWRHSINLSGAPIS